MTSLTPPHPPDLTLHLSDANLTELLSSCDAESTSARSVVELTTASLTAYATASRLGLGLPLRIMVETMSGGPVVLHSYLDPQLQQPHHSAISLVDEAQPLGRGTEDGGELDMDGEDTVNGATIDKGKRNESTDSATFGVNDNEREDDEAYLPPLLVATVVAPSYERLGEARRSAARLERVGLEFQHTWAMGIIEEGEMDEQRESGDHATEDG